MSAKSLFDVALCVGWALPFLIGGIIGTLIYRMMWKYEVWPRGSTSLKAVSAFVSALASSLVGFAAAHFLVGWLNSLPRDPMGDTGTALGLLGLGFVMTMGSAVAGAVAGAGFVDSRERRDARRRRRGIM